MPPRSSAPAAGNKGLAGHGADGRLARLLAPQLLRHDLFAALAVLRVGDADVAAHGGAQAVRGMAAHAPAARPAGKIGPVVGVVRHESRLVDLLDLGRVLNDEAVRLDEIGKHVVARPVAADAPLDVEAILLHAAGAA